MPSTSHLLNAALAFSTVTSTTPETVIFTSPSTGAKLIGDFTGPTLSFTSSGISSGASLLPLTVFGGSKGAVTCDYIREQVASYVETDDVFEELFLKCTTLL